MRLMLAPMEGVSHPMVHGSSLIARSLAVRLGGFDGSLDVTADTDFALRAGLAARLVNVPALCYYRRMRPNSRTSSVETGHGSALRIAETEIVMGRAARNRAAVQAGEAPDLALSRPSPTVELTHILGPRLRR